MGAPQPVANVRMRADQRSSLRRSYRAILRRPQTKPLAILDNRRTIRASGHELVVEDMPTIEALEADIHKRYPYSVRNSRDW